VEQICGGMSVFPTAEKTLSVLVNLILPLCMRMGGGGGNRTGQHSLSLSRCYHFCSAFCYFAFRPL